MAVSVETRNEIVHKYIVDKMSVPVISLLLGIPRTTVYRHLHKVGVVIRPSGECQKVAGAKKPVKKGVKRGPYSDERRQAMSRGKLAWGEKNAKGVCRTAKGYIKHTRGEHEGRGVHTVIMERRIGRRLLPDECVHHIDGDGTNNADNNLALLTLSGHSRLHRLQDKLKRTNYERK